MPEALPKFAPGPWRECGRDKQGGCTCGKVWSIPIDMPVATATVGDWGDGVGKKMMVYGHIPPEIGKANARLIAAAPEMYAALVAALGKQKGWRAAARTALAHIVD